MHAILNFFAPRRAAPSPLSEGPASRSGDRLNARRTHRLLCHAEGMLSRLQNSWKVSSFRMGVSLRIAVCVIGEAPGAHLTPEAPARCATLDRDVVRRAAPERYDLVRAVQLYGVFVSGRREAVRRGGRCRGPVA